MLPNDIPNFSTAIALIAEFVIPPLEAAANNIDFNQHWQPNAGWKEQILDSSISSPLAKIENNI